MEIAQRCGPNDIDIVLFAAITDHKVSKGEKKAVDFMGFRILMFILNGSLGFWPTFSSLDPPETWTNSHAKRAIQFVEEIDRRVLLPLADCEWKKKKNTFTEIFSFLFAPINGLLLSASYLARFINTGCGWAGPRMRFFHFHFYGLRTTTSQHEYTSGTKSNGVFFDDFIVRVLVRIGL